MLNSQRILLWLPMAMVGMLVVAGSALHYRSWDRAAIELKKSQAELNQLKTTNDGIKRAVQSAPDFNATQAQFIAEVPRVAKMGSLLESISAKLTELKIVGEEVLTEPTKAGPKYSREQVTFRFRADGKQTHEILSHLRDAQRLIRVDGVKIEQAQDGGVPTVEIKFSAFSRPMEEATAWLETR